MGSYNCHQYCFNYQGDSLNSIMKIFLVVASVLVLSSAIRVQTEERNHAKETKKHDKRGILQYSYGYPQEQNQIYGPPEEPQLAPEHSDQQHLISSNQQFVQDAHQHHNVQQDHQDHVLLPHSHPASQSIPVVPVEHPVAIPQPVPHPVPVAVPVVQTVIKHVAVPVHIDRPVPVDRPVAVPVAVPVPRPYLVHVEKIVHVDRPVPVPVEKHVHIPVPVDRPVPVHILKPYPVHVERLVAVDKPYPVHVAVPVHVPKPYPVPIAIQYKSHHGW